MKAGELRQFSHFDHRGTVVRTSNRYHRWMTPPDHFPIGSMDQLIMAIERSLDLEAAIDAAWNDTAVPNEPSAKAAAGLCALSLDHGRSLRILLPGVPPSAIVLLRPQYEALVRATWAQHAASEAELARLLVPLTPETQQAAKKLPGVADMIAALEKRGPKGAAALLGRARERLWDGMNSFVHGGIHPFHRGEVGYPAPLLGDLLRNANGMSMLTLIVLAEISGEVGVVEQMVGLRDEFGDVLPLLEAF